MVLGCVKLSDDLQSALVDVTVLDPVPHILELVIDVQLWSDHP